MQRAESISIRHITTTTVTEIDEGIIMIDVHTHILPCIDDGSECVEETIQMLEAMVKSGIKKVVATPHYYPELMTIDEFLEKRRDAYDKIKDKIPEGIEVILGAEVMLAYDLHKDDVKKLAIEDTDYVLVEMPYSHWDPWVFDEVFKISAKHGLDVIIAHIDRYVGVAKKEDINTIFKMNLKYQVNLDYIGGFFHKAPAVKMLKDGAVHFIGYDCHNMKTRTPHLGDTVKKLKSRVGEDCIKMCMLNAERMIQNKSIN